MKKIALPIIAVFASGCIAQEVDLDSLVLADGFTIAVYAKLDGPRQIALGADGVAFVGMQRGTVPAVIGQSRPRWARSITGTSATFTTPSSSRCGKRAGTSKTSSKSRSVSRPSISGLALRYETTPSRN